MSDTELIRIEVWLAPTSGPGFQLHFGMPGDTAPICGCDAQRPNGIRAKQFTRTELLSHPPEEGDCAACILGLQARLRAGTETTDADAPKGSETGE